MHGSDVARDTQQRVTLTVRVELGNRTELKESSLFRQIDGMLELNRFAGIESGHAVVGYDGRHLRRHSNFENSLVEDIRG